MGVIIYLIIVLLGIIFLINIELFFVITCLVFIYVVTKISGNHQTVEKKIENNSASPANRSLPNILAKSVSESTSTLKQSKHSSIANTSKTSMVRYVGMRHTNTIHLESCRFVKDVPIENCDIYNNLDIPLGLGKKTCKVCVKSHTTNHEMLQLDGLKKYLIIHDFHDNNRQYDVLHRVYDNLQVKGYNGINQLVSYLLSGDPTYITSYNKSKELIRKYDRDDYIEALLLMLISRGEKPSFDNEDVSKVLIDVLNIVERNGYNAVNQMVGFLRSGDPTYVPSKNNGRNLIKKIERDEYLECLLKQII